MPAVLTLSTYLQTKTVQPKSKDESGQIIQDESLIHHSNVMLYSKEQKVRSRVGHKCALVIAHYCKLGWHGNSVGKRGPQFSRRWHLQWRAWC